MFCPDCKIWLNGHLQWEDHKRGMKHSLNTRPVLIAADAEARAAKARRLCQEWVGFQRGPEEEAEARDEEASRHRAELEVTRMRAQGVAVAVAAAQQDFAVVVAMKQLGLADEEEVQEARARVARTESRQQRMIDQAVAVSTAAGQRSVDEAVAEVRRLEVAPVRQWLQAALAERDMWRQTAEDTAKAEEGARRLRGRLGARAAAAAQAVAGPIAVD